MLPAMKTMKIDPRAKPATTRIGKIIRERLAKLDRGQAWLSRQIDVAESRVSEWIFGIRRPSDASLIAMARVLDVPITKITAALGTGRRT